MVRTEDKEKIKKANNNNQGFMAKLFGCLKSEPALSTPALLHQREQLLAISKIRMLGY